MYVCIYNKNIFIHGFIYDDFFSKRHLVKNVYSLKLGGFIGMVNYETR